MKQEDASDGDGDAIVLDLVSHFVHLQSGCDGASLKRNGQSGEEEHNYTGKGNLH